jgi:hypothetical protein
VFRDFDLTMSGISTRCRFQEIAENMRGYAMKREANRRDLISPDERDAYMRALVHVVGAKDYATPWSDDGKI